jgi:hypothetical protein
VLITVYFVLPLASAKWNARRFGLDRLDPPASIVSNAKRNSLPSEPAPGGIEID